MRIAIERGIPIPTRGPRHRDFKYPWGRLNVGESFFVPSVNRSNFSTHYANLSHAPKKFISRTMVKQGKKGVRVWRIE